MGTNSGGLLSRRHMLATGAAAVGLGAAGIVTGQGTRYAMAGNLTKIKLEWTEVAACHSPVGFALAKGIFTKHGLDVELFYQCARDQTLFQALATRKADAGPLVPTRPPLGQVERALESEGIPYRIESRSLVFQTDEVRELLALLAAVDDPADEVALITALRSPGLACSDADLADWRLAGGQWRIDGEILEGLREHPVARALAELARLHGERDWKAVNELVAQVVRERRLVELTLARRRPRDHWRRYRFLTDAAQAFVEAGGASLAEFVAWVTAQADGRADRVETVLREADDDAVRIMTVHGSKGLEFPVVVLAGLNADPNTQAPLVAWGPERPEIRFGNRDDGYFETAGYLDVREGDQRFEDAEQRRLLYVAATRAQDHLVVSLHHKPGYRNHASLLYEVCAANGDLVGVPCGAHRRCNF